MFSLMVGSVGISEKQEIAEILPNLKTAQVVFGVRNPQGGVDTLLFIPIGPLCKNFASHFSDLTDFSKPACTVVASDIRFGAR